MLKYEIEHESGKPVEFAAIQGDYLTIWIDDPSYEGKHKLYLIGIVDDESRTRLRFDGRNSITINARVIESEERDSYEGFWKGPAVDERAVFDP